MKISRFLSFAGCACALAIGMAASGQAQPAQQSQSGAPRAPIKATMGTMPSEFLLLKIVVSDVPKSYEFYTKIVGMQRAATGAGTSALPALGPDTQTWPRGFLLNFSGKLDRTYLSIGKPQGSILPTREVAKSIVIGFKVPDAPAVIKRARAAGYEVTSEAPVAGPGELSIGFIRDPDGYTVELLQAGSFPK